jgi:hypothetical protein
VTHKLEYLAAPVVGNATSNLPGHGTNRPYNARSLRGSDAGTMRFNPVGQDDGKRWQARITDMARTGLDGKPLHA